MNTGRELIFGIDGGGTGCRAAVCDELGLRLGEGRSGPSNIMTDLEGARANIIKACREALGAAGLHDLPLDACKAFVGVAGTNVGSRAHDLQQALPFADCVVDSDALIALQGAIGDKDGAVAIIGTGSIYIVRSGGAVRTVGGWGFQVGDQGSGARIGRDLLEETLLVLDGIREGSSLTAEVLGGLGNDQQSVVDFAHSANPGDFGRFAPLVVEAFQAGDQVADRIMKRAIRDVEEALDAVASEADTLCLLGGLGARYAEFLSARFKKILRDPTGNALDGAVALALERFAPKGSR